MKSLIQNVSCGLLIGALFSISMQGMAPRPTPTQPTPPPFPADQVENNQKEIDLANNFFKGKIIIQEPAFPLRAAGAIAWTDDPAPDITTLSYTQLLPDEKLPEPEIAKDVVFESIVDKTFSANAKYLAIVSGEMSSEDKAAVSLQIVLRALGPQFLSTKVSAALPGVIAILKKPGRRIFYIETVQYVLSSSSILKKTSASGSGSFFVTIGANTYQSSSRANNARMAVVEYIDLTGSNITPLVVNNNAPLLVKHVNELNALAR